MLSDDDPFPVRAAAEHRIDRRRFLVAAASAAAVVVVSERLVAPPRPAGPRATVVLPDAGALAIGEARAIATPGGVPVLAVRLDAMTVVGFDRRCPHLGCPVVWSAERARFECPCHRAAFDGRTGRVLTGPPRQGLSPITLEIA